MVLCTRVENTYICTHLASFAPFVLNKSKCFWTHGWSNTLFPHKAWYQIFSANSALWFSVVSDQCSMLVLHFLQHTSHEFSILRLVFQTCKHLACVCVGMYYKCVHGNSQHVAEFMMHTYPWSSRTAPYYGTWKNKIPCRCAHAMAQKHTQLLVSVLIPLSHTDHYSDQTHSLGASLKA